MDIYIHRLHSQSPKATNKPHDPQMENEQMALYPYHENVFNNKEQTFD